MGMFKLVLSFFMLMHILGDFYFQTDKMAQRKRTKYRYVVGYSLLYMAVFCIGSLAVWSAAVACIAAALSVLHFAIDSLKYCCLHFHKKPAEAVIYSLDQLLHIVIIGITAGIVTYGGYPLSFQPWAERSLLSIGADGGTVLGWICVFFTVCKPVNVTIKQLLVKYRPAEADKSVSKNAGAFIGTLERIIIALLLSVGQYSAIGLVLTAKSIARYDKISKDQTFAEYYLLGTLLSTLFVIAAFFVFM